MGQRTLVSISSDLPLFGFAYKNNDEVKVSARAS